MLISVVIPNLLDIKNIKKFVQIMQELSILLFKIHQNIMLKLVQETIIIDFH